MSVLKRDTASQRITDKAQPSKANEACPLCGRTASAPWQTIREFLLNAVCAGVRLAILAPVLWFSEQWLEAAGRLAVNRMVWRAGRELESMI